MKCADPTDLGNAQTQRDGLPNASTAMVAHIRPTSQDAQRTLGMLSEEPFWYAWKCLGHLQQSSPRLKCPQLPRTKSQAPNLSQDLFNLSKCETQPKKFSSKQMSQMMSSMMNS
ncbi:hypothetical protein AVEN_134835-1 [Araneus ventricosus]|uniref:Uncharacterized protein n=1 Tax=Araneus ventricosus TaxID=182803 RepID=A0A4Y2NAN8_ARAVE|nr:hypothetical protein AVEN_134835-1 [Araneus ventricosus]